MNLRVLLPIGVALALGAAAIAATTRGPERSSPSPETRACPGTVVCPQTGERICADRCPLAGEAADECPGTIVCPIDGQTICEDRCPLAGEKAAVASASGPCCAGAGSAGTR